MWTLLSCAQDEGHTGQMCAHYSVVHKMKDTQDRCVHTTQLCMVQFVMYTAAQPHIWSEYLQQCFSLSRYKHTGHCSLVLRLLVQALVRG